MYTRTQRLAERRVRTRRTAGRLAVLGGAVALATAASAASFTSASSVSQPSISTQALAIGIPAPGAANRLTLGALSVVPGDTMQRVVDLTNTASDDFGSITLTTVATASSLLDTDAVNGLQLTIDRCSQAWTESGVSPAFTYTCGGTTTSTLASRAVIGSNLALSGLTLTAGSTNHLRLTLNLPLTAPNSLQGLSSAITYTFTAVQRTGTSM
jgi:spore coat-associated protein N